MHQVFIYVALLLPLGYYRQLINSGCRMKAAFYWCLVANFALLLLVSLSTNLLSFEQVSRKKNVDLRVATNWRAENRTKLLAVIGVYTAPNNRERRNALRQTWMPRGEELRKLETERGIVVRFVVGRSGDVSDHEIAAENAEFGDFLVFDNTERHDTLSAKTKTYFSTIVSKWDAEFYVKVDDDIHVNIGRLAATLDQLVQQNGALYIGCIHTTELIKHKSSKYYEPEHWKFGKQHFVYAMGPAYAVSKNIANYISSNKHLLHDYANEDVSMGSWLIGLNVQHVDDHSFCCSSWKSKWKLRFSSECERKARSGNPCVASYDLSCNGVCGTEDLFSVHQACS